jgi:sodium-dependent dicarboxylate transporter 2/3/5
MVPQRAAPAWIGLAAGPLLALLVYIALPDPTPDETSLSSAGRATAAIAVLMATWWVTEALPLAATALLPIVLFPLCGVVPVRQATAPYAHELIFLFLGGFMLAQALERWGLHRRVALLTLLCVGTRPARLVAGFMLASAFISMWISNTATTVMMLPIAVSVLSLVANRDESDAATDPDRTGSPHRGRPGNFATCLMLGVAYGASIGGTATLIGSPPNVFLAGFLETNYGIELGFGRWMLIGLPVAVVFLPLAWLALTRLLYPPPKGAVVGGRQIIRDELHKLGPMSRGEKTVLAVFLLTAVLWMTREPLTQWRWLLAWFPTIANLSDAGIAVSAALLLFAIPVNAKRRVFALDWRTAQRLPWGALLLFGGGLSLAAAFRSSGLDVWISGPARLLAGQHVAILVGVVVILIVFFTELSSNTATTATFLPVLSGVALGVGVHPTLLVVPATLAASCAFMMPVATPPNAIVFGSGHVRIAQMVRAGLVLNIISIVLINIAAHTLVVWAIGGR